MARLPVLSGREVVKALRRAGFVVVSQKGSHVRLHGTRGGLRATVIVPLHPELAAGTMLAILEQAGLSREEFQALL